LGLGNLQPSQRIEVRLRNQEETQMGALSILLIAAGAIMAWAVKDTSSGFDIHMIGIILLVVGIVGLIVSLARGSWLGFTSRRESHVSNDGRTVVESERTSSF
jgi:uncharacterized protein DUF6458